MKLRLLISMSTTLLLLTGCYPTGEIKNTPDKSSKPTDERLNISVSLPKDYPHDISNLTCEPMIFENIDVETIFFGNEKGDYWKEINENSVVLSTGKYYHLYAKGENKTTLFYDAGIINYISTNAFEKNYNLFPNYYSVQHSESGMQDIFPNNEIPDFSANEAESQVLSVIEALRLPVYDTPEIYAIDQSAADNAGIEQWDSSDDAYMFIYPMNYNNLPSLCSSVNNISGTLNASPSGLSVVVSRNGIEYFEAAGVMDNTNAVETKSTFSAEKALTTLENYYSSIAFQNNILKIETNGCSLHYINNTVTEKNNSYELIPVWSFYEKRTIKTENGTDMPFYSTICVNAINGEIY